MYQSIVVGTDGSEKDLTVVRRAVELAGRLGATVHIAHGFKPVTSIAAGIADSAPGASTVDFEALDEAIDAENRHVMGDAAAVAQAAGVTVTTHAMAGEPAEVLCDLAREVAGDLIVIGNHGLHSRKRFLQGSVANRVVHHAPCSVLVVDVEPPR
jgi:nucleotide-binding universal stress UspA family protein